MKFTILGYKTHMTLKETMSLLLGYACINTELPTHFKTCRLATFHQKGTEIIKKLSLHNLENVIGALNWNIENEILFYRISSNIIPLGSHEDMNWEWWKDKDVLELTGKIKQLQQDYRLRLSMHPGQYTVISTPRDEVFARSLADLEYHDHLMNLVGGTDMIIHGGGAYGDIETAKIRYAQRYETLSSSIKNKLRLENDDVTYQLSDVLDINGLCGVPICFDIHHHHCNHGEELLESMIPTVFASWPYETKPKVHISSGKDHHTDRRHHDYVFKEDFEKLLTVVDGKDVDIMLEAKKKEQAVLKVRKEYPNFKESSN